MYKEDNFDIMVKSTLESGSEEVPAGLWESVEKRVAATAPVRSGRHPLWKRWAVGIAFACVAACCLLLFTPRREESSAPVAASAPVITPVTVSNAVAELTETADEDSGKEMVGTSGTATTVEMSVTTEVTELPEMTETETPPEKTERNIERSEVEQIMFPEDEIPQRRIRFALTGSAMSGSHSGSRSSIADRMSTSQMDFGTEEKIYENAGTFYMIPVSAGLGVRINFTKHWALGIGLNYTFLRRRFEGSYDYGGTENYFCKDIANNQHYIGIPVNAYYNIVTGNRLKFYVYAGGAIEKCVSNSYSFNYYGYTKVLKQSVGGIQASVNAGLGLQFCITDRFGIYLDPSFRYYFRNYLQPKSVRTDQPFQINAELGLRWDL